MKKPVGKKVAKGLLKITAGIAPYILAVGGIVGGITCIGLMATNTTIDDYKHTETFQSQYTEDSRDLDAKFYEIKSINFDEYRNKREHLSSDDYVKEVISMDYEGNYEWQERLKTLESYRPAGLASSITAGVAWLFSIPYFDLKGKSLVFEGRDDIREAKTNYQFNHIGLPNNHKKLKKIEEEEKEHSIED